MGKKVYSFQVKAIMDFCHVLQACVLAGTTMASLETEKSSILSIIAIEFLTEPVNRMLSRISL